MGRLLSYNRREVASKRFRFLFYEIVPIFLMAFIFLILGWFFLPLIVNPTSELYGMIFYLIRALAIFLVIIIFLFISNKIKTKNSQPAKNELALHTGYLKLYKMTGKNYTYQLLYSCLLFFLILIPIEFLFSFFLPETIPYRAVSLILRKENTYLLLADISVFLFFSIIIQLSLSFSAETIFRGLITKRGSEYFNKMSAVMISTFSFTFIELFLNPIIFIISYHIGVIWFIKSFVVGLVLSLTIIRRKWLFPLIIAKTLDSIITSVIIWDYFRGGNFIQLLFFIYIPLLIISLILFLLQRSRIKESLQIGIKLIKSYSRNDVTIKETSGDKIFRIIFDIFYAFLLFLFGILISV